jgi:DNA-binding beta-propeller fold protein YncE
LVFDLKSNALLGTIPAMPDSDGIIYDKTMNRVLAVSGEGSALMVVDPSVDSKHGNVEQTIDLGGKPEFLAADDHGEAYVNLEDKDVVAVVDLRENKVTDRWPVAPGGQPVGVAMDKKKRLLFIGCRKPQKIIIMNANEGKVVSDLFIGAGVDATKFDGKQAFASCLDGKLHIVSTTAHGKFAVVQTVTTAEGREQ